MRFDANSIKCDIDDINEKIDYLKYIIETKQDELDKINKQIRDLHESLSTKFIESIHNVCESKLRDYHTQIIDNIQKIIV